MKDCEETTYVEAYATRMANGLREYLGQTEHLHPDFHHFMTSADEVHGAMAASDHIAWTVNQIAKKLHGTNLPRGSVARGATLLGAGVQRND